MHELHNQEKIDILFCGASHVSHGLLPSLMDKELEQSTFCTGTPSQGISETCAIIKDVVSFYDIKEIFLEMDFAVATTTSKNIRTGSAKNKYLATKYLKNQKVKFSHILETTSPAYFLNEFLPIGANKLIDLNPISVAKIIKSKVTGEYSKYIYKADDSDYAGKGCVFDHDFIANGTFTSRGKTPIKVENINDNYKNIIRNIIKICKQNNIKLTFYAQPNSDFYLCDKGNYDEYYLYIKDFLHSEGYDFYDFNLGKNEYLSFEDKDYSDDNHFNESGIRKFTEFFCNSYRSQNKTDFFHQTYEEKLHSQQPKILGLALNEAPNKKSLEIKPILNHGDVSKVTYTVTVKTLNENNKIKEKINTPLHIFSKKILEKSNINVIEYPPNSFGELEIYAYYDNIENCHVKTNFTSM